MKIILLALIAAAIVAADGTGVIESVYSTKDFALTANPSAAQWRKIKGVIAENNQYGKPTPGHRTEIRARWTAKNLYLLYICSYELLYLNENMDTKNETNKLWDRDVAEVFAGAEFDKIWHYREYQVSPQGEWVDLDIDRKNPLPDGGWKWNSGFEVKARIDKDKKIWYGEMRIPIASFDSRAPQAGNEIRMNFYRLQGPPPKRNFIAWQPTNGPSYHVPEAFGRMRLVKEAK